MGPIGLIVHQRLGMTCMKKKKGTDMKESWLRCSSVVQLTFPDSAEAKKNKEHEK